MSENSPDSQTSKSLIRADSEQANRSSWWIVLVLVGWLGLIFGTSCTVIRPHEFFALVQYFVPVDESSMHRFRLFWGVSWFAIVKGWHFTEFTILLLLCNRLLNWWHGSQKASHVAIGMVFCIVFAASDEWHQSFVPDRHGTVMDVLIDSLGVLTAGLFLLSSHARQGQATNIETIPSNGLST